MLPALTSSSSRHTNTTPKKSSQWAIGTKPEPDEGANSITVHRKLSLRDHASLSTLVGFKRFYEPANLVPQIMLSET